MQLQTCLGTSEYMSHVFFSVKTEKDGLYSAREGCFKMVLVTILRTTTVVSKNVHKGEP